MSKQLPLFHFITKTPMYTCMYILLTMMCVTAYSQPTMVSSLPAGSKNFVTVNGNLYYSVADNLYKASSTTAPVLVKTTGETILRIYDISASGRFFFITQNGTGQRLWRSDGTTANTVGMMSATQIVPLLTYQSQLFFKAVTAETGSELWKMDAGFNTTLLKDINPGSANGYQSDLIVHNNLLYFFGNGGSGTDLWRSDGTTAGTVVAVDLDSSDYYNTSGFYGLTSVNDIMFFTINYEGADWYDRQADLYKTNGTAAGTSVIFHSDGEDTYNYFSDFLAFKGKLYFFHTTGAYPLHNLSVSDGTTAGTRHIKTVTIDGGPREMINAGDYFLYYAESQGFTTPIEKSDGTTITEVHEFSEYHMEPDEYVDLTYTNGFAFFLDHVSENGGSSSFELWQADLASGTTQPVANIHGLSLSNSRNITAADGSIYFTRTVSGQMSLWYYNPTAPTCSGNGTIQREKWANVSGSAVSQIPVTTQPTSFTTLTSFTTPRNEGDNYGARIRGYVCVPQNGNYVFYISSDDNSELWLSTDDNPAHKKLIASSKWTGYNEWTKYPTQTSAAIPLQTGRRYYIEALHKEAAGADHLSVGWKLPDGTLERPMPGLRLIPFRRGIAPSVTVTQPASDGTTYYAGATIDIAATVTDADGAIDKVEFYANGRFLGEDTAPPYTAKMENVTAGDYSIDVRATDNEGNVGRGYRWIKVQPAPSCTGTGSIFQELWANVTGNDVRTFNFSTSPNGGGRYFNNFETSQYYANNYASRMRGYLCVPQTGNYTLWISSDDYSELYLSTDESEANKKLIAWVYGATSFRNYDKYPSQKSVQINLQAGRKYYVEARHKEGTGNDFVSVGWQLPDGTLERPIPGQRLISLVPPPNQPPSITITSPAPNQNYSSPASVTISADVTDPDGLKYVDFVVSDGFTSQTLATFTAPPYQYVWNNVPPGSYYLIVSAADTKNSGTSKTLYFSVDKTACEGTGTLVREIWTGIPGTSVSSIPVNSSPNKTVNLTSLATPNYYGNDYGSRIRGYFCPPTSGLYTFWISSDDNSELWLSPNADPADKVLIASVTGATNVNQWDKYGTQVNSRSLVQGQRYYFEVLHKEANGGDHVEVGWRLPDGTMERPVPGNRLIPFEEMGTAAAAFAPSLLEGSEEGANEISVYPNPVNSGQQLSISLPSESLGDVEVDVINATGVTLQNENMLNSSGSVTVDLKPSITPGIYIIKVANSRKRWLSKVHIK